MSTTRAGALAGDLDEETLDAVRKWAEPALLAGPLPAFGTAEWLELDPERQGYAAIRMALSAWTAHAFGAGVPSEVLDRAVAARMGDASRAVQAADPATWQALASRRAELHMPLPEFRKAA